MDQSKQVAMNQPEFANFLQTLIDSKKLPAHVKSVQDAFTIAQMGKELGFPIMQAMHYILPIEGKLTLCAKALNALLRRGGVKITCTEDAVWIYADGTTSDYKKEGVSPIDRRTTIQSTRDGIVELTNFTWRDAEAQGLTTKLNWKKMPR